MRPVLLELAGFGSFREPTTVDFRAAEYFALVGPTGSGKSTVIDAMTFALYGSVPRWDNARTVALALAPTIARGTVRFVFDVAAPRPGQVGRRERYVVARELRRAASGGVSVRTARLERLRDPEGTGAVDEETEPVADGAAATTKAVEELLGLPFGDFTTCVVLPQGEFAEFLHTEPRKRQETLVRLLGLGVYDVIAKEANLEARSQEQRAQVLSEQLGGYDDDTVAAEQAAAERVAELTALRSRVESAVPLLTAATGELAEVEASLTRLAAERSRLAGLTAPEGLDGLAAQRRSAEEAVTSARSGLEAAEAADTAAREAVAAAPPRGPLEAARRHHAERREIAAELPGARERHTKARDADAAAGADATAARTASDEARGALGVAAAALAEAREAGSRIAAERDAFRAVVGPAGLDALDERRSAATTAAERAAAALTAAERRDAAARAALAGAPDRAPLEQARRDHRDLVDARAAHTAARAAADTAERALAAARADVAAVAAHLDHARERRAASLRADLAAALRPGLVAGEECPVCAQAVAALPEPLPDGDLAAADAALAAAEATHDDARRAEARASAEHAKALAEAGAATAAVERLTTALAAVVLPDGLAWAVAPDAVEEGGAAEPARVPGPSARVIAVVAQNRPESVTSCTETTITGAGEAARSAEGAIPSAEAIEAALAHLDGLAGEARAADEALRKARAERDRATAEVEAARAEAAAAATALRAARDPLVSLGAPAADDADPVAGWAALVTWATAQVDARDAALPAARDRYAAVLRDHQAAEQAMQTAERVAEQRRREETAAARAEQEASGLVTHLEERDRALVAALRDAPGDDDAAAALERLAALEAAVRVADAALRSARAAVRSAEGAAAAVERETAAAWAELRAARDPLVALEAPAVGEEDLVGAWAELVAWAAAAADVRAAGIRDAEASRAATSARRTGTARRLVDDLATHGIAPEVPAALDRAAIDRVTSDLAAAGPAADRADARGARVDPVGADSARGDTAAGAAVAGTRAEGDPVAIAAVVADPGGAATAAATEVERARGAHARIVERRAAAAGLAADRDAAVAAQQVAKMLGNLLRSDGFPRWLVASALDSLVVDASVSLAELSGGQFELTHDNGEFLVVDHTDADARRPVKTLSGGETFQASLALALALSAQMSGLAAHGAARLESIFLDEGFGTLDEANLETVASTLEALATRGDRVVGVITHVPALAERVPVRFAVRRDQRSSSITREGP